MQKFEALSLRNLDQMYAIQSNKQTFLVWNIPWQRGFPAYSLQGNLKSVSPMLSHNCVVDPLEVVSWLHSVIILFV